MARCKYCRKDLADGGCKAAHLANTCPNTPQGVVYQDRPNLPKRVRAYSGFDCNNTEGGGGSDPSPF